jgi:hypothetical protein
MEITTHIIWRCNSWLIVTEFYSQGVFTEPTYSVRIRKQENILTNYVTPEIVLINLINKIKFSEFKVKNSTVKKDNVIFSVYNQDYFNLDFIDIITFRKE